MIKLKDIFQNLATFARYAPGVETSHSLDDLQAACNSASKRMKGVLTAEVFDLVATSSDETVTEPLRLALANMTLSIQLAFDAVNRRKNAVDVYKYELDAMRRAYTENYYSAMDTLLTAVAQADAESELGKAWAQSRYQRLLTACRVKTADDFDAIYSIDGSHLFFFRTLSIQKELLDTQLSNYFDRTEGNERLTDLLKLVLCKKVVATALRRFDIMECPATIRNLTDEQVTNGQRKDERENANALATQLDGEADALIGDIDAMLNAADGLDVSSMSAFNQPDDNIIMMP